jgi:hypothetical protein
MPKSFQRAQRIGGIHPPLLVGESKTVVQIVRELGKQLPIGFDGSCPILERGVVLTINQQTIFRPQTPGKSACKLDFSTGFRRVA